jgi:two-component system chemotaxis response regulator CheY
VDDSTTMRRMVRAALHGCAGLTFAEAGSGLEAIEHLVLTPPALIILDLNRPDMHGLDVLQFVRSQPATRALPVLVLTTRDDSASRSSVLAAGASAYLTKPFEPAVLATTVQTLLGQA